MGTAPPPPPERLKFGGGVGRDAHPSPPSSDEGKMMGG
jgi:hypothetical protein